MKKSTMKLSRKIQVQIDLPKVEERQAALRHLHQWQQCGFRAANMLISHLFVQQVLEGAPGSLNEDLELGHLENDFFPEVVKRFGEKIPLQMLEGIQNTITRNFYKERPLYLEGKRSLKSYDKNLPLPFELESLKGLHFDKRKKAFCFSLFSVPFRTYLGRDVEDKKLLLDQYLSGEISMARTRLQLTHNKLFLMVVFELETEEHDLRPDVVAEAYLSPDFPIVLKIKGTTFTIGSREEFLFRRLAIQAAYKRSEDGVTFARAGKGKKRKTKALARLQEWERNYVHHRLHLYSRILIDHCIQNKAGVLVLVRDQEPETQGTEDATLLKDWDYYELGAKIQGKAQKAGIEMVSEPVAAY